MRFARYQTWRGSTWAYSRFQKHHTEINSLYWSYVPVASYVIYLARHAPLNISPEGLFHATGPDAYRISSNINLWRSNFREFQNWVRLSSVMSISSYFETYLQTSITLALLSDPLVRFGSSMMIDGVVWLKRGVRSETEELV